MTGVAKLSQAISSDLFELSSEAFEPPPLQPARTAIANHAKKPAYLFIENLPCGN